MKAAFNLKYCPECGRIMYRHNEKCAECTYKAQCKNAGKPYRQCGECRHADSCISSQPCLGCFRTPGRPSFEPINPNTP